MFQLSDHESSMTNLNSRIERHGDSRELAVDLKFETKASNTILDSLEKGLKESLFRKPGKGEQQELIEGNQLVAVKHTCLEPLRLSHEFAGYELTIEGALGVADLFVHGIVENRQYEIEPALKDTGIVDHVKDLNEIFAFRKQVMRVILPVVPRLFEQRQ